MNNLSVFKTPEGEAQFLTAYDAILARWPVPYEELNIPTSFGTTHIIANGKPNAKPLILLHCSMGTATAWLLNVAELSKQYRVYAIDVIGEPNKSVPSRKVKNRNEFAQWLLDVFNKLNINRANIIGNSYGGFLALNQASHTPDRIERIVLISPAATFAQIWPFYFHMYLPMILGLKKSFKKAGEWIQQGIAFDNDWSKLSQIVYKYGKPINMVFPIVFKKTELQVVQNPVLLLIGDKEVIYKPEKTIKKAKQLMPTLQAEIVPNANHIAAMTNPDYVNKQIIEFLQSDHKSKIKKSK
jgi:pimeloyl-ACP methyl ester carboxylesterase